MESARPSRTTVLLVEPDEGVRHRLRGRLRGDDRLVMPAATVAEALALASSVKPAVVLTSLMVPDQWGARVVDTFRTRVGVPVVALADEPSTAEALDAVRRGASDVVAATDPDEDLVETLRRAIAGARAEIHEKRVGKDALEQTGFNQLLSQSPRMLQVFDQIRLVARTDATALILGETGTGKELVSRAIHERSQRRDRPFVAVNCGAFAESLLESELFGHEKGSFTGAVGRRDGLFEMADGGTLFLDELGETTLNVQVNLLRVLEEMCFRRVGGREMVHVDVRIIAATNVQLEKAVADGKFRQDLYYRLAVFPIVLPPLRERREDIPLLVRHFLDEVAGEYRLEPPRLSAEAVQRILAYDWPGNVRQLRAMCERWVVAFSGQRVREEDLPAQMFGGAELAPSGSPPVGAPIPSGAPLDLSRPMQEHVDAAVADVERRYLEAALHRHGGHLSRTAEASGITRRTLYNKMRQLGLDADTYKPEGR
ncbi:MAG: sigma-54-dependent Fis family transcriptional regulator [Alphaproteobacteria bacterium]|nr:sigma-54-dependent Fis family transcriptional regulator [Alphaproteobacteria bacterium]